MAVSWANFNCAFLTVIFFLTIHNFLYFTYLLNCLLVSSFIVLHLLFVRPYFWFLWLYAPFPDDYLLTDKMKFSLQKINSVSEKLLFFFLLWQKAKLWVIGIQLFPNTSIKHSMLLVKIRLMTIACAVQFKRNQISLPSIPFWLMQYHVRYELQFCRYCSCLLV